VSGLLAAPKPFTRSCGDYPVGCSGGWRAEVDAGRSKGPARALVHFVGVTAIVGCAPTFSVLAARCRTNTAPVPAQQPEDVVQGAELVGVWSGLASARQPDLVDRGRSAGMLADLWIGRPSALLGRGRPDHLILCTAFKLPLRQTEGLLASVLTLMDLTISAPDHTTVSRRAVNLPVIQAAQVPRGPMHGLIEAPVCKSTGRVRRRTDDPPSRCRPQPTRPGGRRSCRSSKECPRPPLPPEPVRSAEMPG
jgi:Transposase DDE domain